jgi:hypothetical protein
MISIGIKSDNEIINKQITFPEILEFLKKDLFQCYGCNNELKRIVSDHKQWDRLICEIYKRLLGHKHKEETNEEIINWLFPPKIEII